MSRFAITRGADLVAVYDTEEQARGALDSYGPGCDVGPHKEEDAPAAKADPAEHQAAEPAPSPTTTSAASYPAATSPAEGDDGSESKTPSPVRRPLRR